MASSSRSPGPFPWSTPWSGAASLSSRWRARSADRRAWGWVAWRHGEVPMREECTHFQSRTYASGEAARFCVLDLAPEAPWRCPDKCPSYHRRLADVGWVHGSLVEPALENEPGPGGPDVAAFLSSVEDIVNEVAPAVLAEVREEDARKERASRRWWRKKR